MRVWLRLTSLFGLPDDQPPENLMAAALGPIIRAAGRDLVEAPLPLQFQRFLEELRRGEQLIVARKTRGLERAELTARAIGNGAANEPAIVHRS